MNQQTPPGDTSEIVVYWRPGCGFCSRLLRQLDAQHIPHRLINIWDDPGAAATVRSMAGGNETVPTVSVGPVALVNPRVDQILAAAIVHAPDSVPDGYEAPEPRGLGKLITKALGRNEPKS